MNIVVKVVNLLKQKILFWMNYLKNCSKRRLVFFIVCFIGISVILWAFFTAKAITSNFNKNQVTGNNKEQSVNAQAQGLILTETKNGKKYFEIYGETGSYSDDNSVAILNNVIGNFYKDNQVAMSIQASKGAYDEQKGTITLYDNIFIALKDMTSMHCNKLTWLGEGKQTIAEGNVTIKKEKEMRAKAKRCIINPDYDRFKIAGATKIEIFEKGSVK